MNRAIKGLADALKDGVLPKQEARNPYFGDSRYLPYPLDNKNFHNLQGIPSEKTIVAVDGGNVELVHAPNFSLSLVRVALSAYRNNRKINIPVDEVITIYCLAYASAENGKIKYKARLFPLYEKHRIFLPDEKDLEFDAFDPTITGGKKRASISKIGAIARRFCEWKMAGYACGLLNPGDIVVKDGSLQTGTTNESTYSNAAYERAIKNSVIFCGLSKTSSLLTDAGTSISGHIMKMAEESGSKKPWTYHPVAKIEHPDHRADMSFVCLSDSSKHCFRFEILNKQENLAGEVICALAKNSTDVSFPGYPYALIDADRRARVRMNETEQHRIMFLAYASKDESFKELAHHISSTDAHGILDRMIR